MCGVVHIVCTNNKLTIHSNKYLPCCSPFYDYYYWNIQKHNKVAFKMSQIILNQKFKNYFVTECISAMMQQLVKN